MKLIIPAILFLAVMAPAAAHACPPIPTPQFQQGLGGTCALPNQAFQTSIRQTTNGAWTDNSCTSFSISNPGGDTYSDVYQWYARGGFWVETMIEGKVFPPTCTEFWAIWMAP